jgi:uncharacterized membrane protein
LIAWKVQCTNCGDKEEENQEEMKTIIKLYCLLLQELVTFVNPKDTRQLIAPRKKNQAVEAAEAVAVVATREDASSWGLATSAANSVAGKGIGGKSNRTGASALKDTDRPNRPM